MQKKKSDNRLSLPSVGVLKPNENSKNYTSKANLNKCKELEDKNIYFEMPSIHQNDISMKTLIEGDEKGIRKIQIKIMKLYEQWKESRMIDEWELYMKKSEIINSRISEFYEIEEYLLKTNLKLLMKLNENLMLNSFSFNKSKLNPIDISYLKE